jgi:hypothetical protein
MKVTGWKRLPDWVPVAIEAGYLDWSDIRPLVLGEGRRVAVVERPDDQPREASVSCWRTVAVTLLLLGLVLLAGGVR